MGGDYIAKLALDIGVAIVLAVSLTMVNGFTGQFSMGHAGFMAVGGYASGAVTYYYSLRAWGSVVTAGGILSGRPMSVDPATLPVFGAGDGLFVLALIVGGLTSAGLGVVVGMPSLRLKGDYLAIVTLGFGEIVRVCIQQTGPIIKDAAVARDTAIYKLPGSVGGALGFTGIPKYTSMFWVYLAAAVTLLVAYRLKYSTYGRAFLSIREDEVAAEAMGVNTTRYKVWAFVISAFFAGVAGGLFSHTLGVGLSAESAGFQKSFDIIIMVVLGGLGSISGATIAAIVVTLLPELLRSVKIGDVELGSYRLIIYSLALILMMIFRPKGLLGVREVWDFWPRRKVEHKTGGGA
jgi:branched-chain amino acid transport system permease protein